MRFLLSIFILLYPFQILALEVGTTRFDLFPISIVLLNLLLLLSKLSKRYFYVNRRYFFISIILLVANILAYFNFSFQPNYRFFSGFFWVINLLILGYFSRFGYSKRFYSNFFSITIVIAIVIILQNILGLSNRPKAFFHEPSTAGLVLYSFAFVYLARILLRVKNKKSNIILFSIFFLSALSTRSSHLFVFVIFCLFLFVIIRVNIPFLILFISLLIVLGLFSNTFFPTDYYIDKFDFFSNTTMNLSQLSWLRGLDQAFYTWNTSPFFGFGFGSTGFFDFPTDYNDILNSYNSYDLNLLDSYSLLFRLIIEIGVVFVLILTYYVFSPLFRVMRFSFRKGLCKYCELYLIGSFIIFGSFIKEPNYGVSPLFVGVLLIGMSLPNLYSKIYVQKGS